MNYFEANQEINNGIIKPIYLIYGEETYLIAQLLESIINKLLPQKEQRTGVVNYIADPGISKLVNLIEAYPVFDSKNIIVVQETGLFKNSRNNTAAEEEGESKSGLAIDKLIKLFGNMPEYSIVLFMVAGKKVKQSYKEVSKLNKLYKAIEKFGAAVEVLPLSIKETRPWIVHRLAEDGKKAVPGALDYIMEVLSIMPQISLGFLDNELAKLVLYCRESREITRQSIMEVLSSVPEVSIFSMLEALSNKETAKTAKLLKAQLAEGEPPLKILALLSRQSRLLLQAKVANEKGLGSKNLANSLGLPQFIAKKMLRQSNSFSQETLRKAVLAIAELDYRLKSGLADGSDLVQFIIELMA